MKKLVWQSVLLVVSLLVVSFIFRVRMDNTYTAYLPEIAPGQETEQSSEGEAREGTAGGEASKEGIEPNSAKAEAEAGAAAPGSTDNGSDPAKAEGGAPDFEVHVRNMENETDGIEIQEAIVEGDMPVMEVQPKEPGEYIARVEDSSGETVARRHYYVDEFHNIYDMSTGGFTGDLILMSVLTIFFLVESFLMLRTFFESKGSSFYSYTTIHLAGFSLFLLLIGVILLITTIQHQLDPATVTMKQVYGFLSSASLYYMLFTSPFVFAFAGAMTVSNIALIRHEGRRFRNFMGILISVVMAVGEIIGILIFYFRNAHGVETTPQALLVFQNLLTTGYVYFECMLIGAIICGVIAAEHVPDRDCSHIMILGCGFRKDGTLPPLLRGRVDKAIEFWKMQQEENKPAAIFVPSGGQGPHECMAEAQAMENYLLSQGIPKSSILPEMNSRNTYQNMAYSKELIEEKDPHAKVVFSTTNYHVFRSGVWASLAGLHAEGIGSQTKWWFWPNAFMRECIGLLANRWKQEIVLMLVMMGIFTVLSILL